MTKKLSDTDGLKALGKTTEYILDGADKSLLERFPNPLKLGPGLATVRINSPEDKFTSLCPLTGQPDYADIVVEYMPRNWCVESKSWKLYLNSFRNYGEFHESCVRRMANNLIELLDPWMLRITGEFTPRGGIQFWPSVAYSRPSINFDFLEVPKTLEDRNIFYIGESVFEKVENSDSEECSLTSEGTTIGTATIAECEAGLWDEMARKYASTNYKFKDRKRLKEFLEETFGYEIDKETVVTVVWFKDVVLFDQDQDLGDASGIVPLHKDK